MNEQDLFKAMQSDDTDASLLAELRSKLNTELEKPEEELDIDAINEITLMIDQISGSEQRTKEQTERGIQKLNEKIRQQRRGRIRRRVTRIAVCAGIVLVITNVFSYSAYGMNSFSAAYQLMTGGIVIDFQKDDSEPYYGNQYLDEMQKACQEHEFDVMLPRYIPKDFSPTEIFGDYIENEVKQILDFYFANKKAVLNLSITKYADNQTPFPIGVPSDSHNISQQRFGDITVHISKEVKDHQYWALFQIGSYQYVLSTQNLDYDECQRVLESVFDAE